MHTIIISIQIYLSRQYVHLLLSFWFTVLQIYSVCITYILLTQKEFNIIPGEGIQTTYPSYTTTGDFTQNTTGYQLKNQTDKDKPKNSAHSENNTSNETRTNGVAIFVLYTIITILALSIYLVIYLKKKKGVSKTTQRHDIESHGMIELWILSYIVLNIL